PRLYGSYKADPDCTQWARLLLLGSGMGKPLTYLAVAILLAATAGPAAAQPEFSKDNVMKMIRKVGIHANVGEMKPLSDNVTKGLTKGVSIGLAPGQHNGWKFPVGSPGTRKS